MKVPGLEFFHIEEFVSKSVFKQFGEKSLWFIDPKVIQIARFVRNRMGKPVNINTWKWRENGGFQYRGLREQGVAIGAAFSQHRFGRGLDLDVVGMGVSEIMEDIQKQPKLYMEAGVTTVEDPKFTPTWVHFDCRPTNKKEILWVKP